MKRNVLILLCFAAGVGAYGQKTGYMPVNRRLSDDGKGGIHPDAAAVLGSLFGVTYQKFSTDFL